MLTRKLFPLFYFDHGHNHISELHFIIALIALPSNSSEPDYETPNYQHDDDTPSNYDDKDSNASSTTRERESKHCECCYCEFFGQGVSEKCYLNVCSMLSGILGGLGNIKPILERDAS